VVILDSAAAPEFAFLGLDRLSPVEKRFEGVEEDAFREKMLLLDAKWRSSYARYAVLKGAALREGGCVMALEEGWEPEPEGERMWIGVAWPKTGGIVVSVFDTTIFGFDRDADGFVPGNVARLALCANMDDKAAVFGERFRGRWFAGVEEYKGDGFIELRRWMKAGEKEGGDVRTYV
jgi:hypothetical protein